jgi:hypothetical protein
MNKTMISLAIFILSTSLIFAKICDKETHTKDCPPETSPVWPDQFEQSFTETFTYPVIGSSQTKGKFYYDWINKRYRVDRENGKYDRYCGTVYKLTNTPCSHIVTEGDRYLYYPEKDYCCYCCSSDHGCGLLKPDWLQGAEFVDYVTEQDGTIYEKWDKKGLQHNYYMATAKDRIMKQIDQQPNDTQDFDVNSFKNKISDPAVFNLPSKCNKSQTCPIFSVCTALRFN